MKAIVMAVIATAAMLIVVTPTQAKRCDGFNGCRCGTTAARDHGLPYDYHGMNLKEARAWYAFPHTSCHVGAVGIPHPHHVYTVRSCNGDGTVTVHDDAGTYRRSIARGTVFVDAGGNVQGRVQEAHLRHRHHHYRRYAPRYAPQYVVQYASYNY